MSEVKDSRENDATESTRKVSEIGEDILKTRNSNEMQCNESETYTAKMKGSDNRDVLERDNRDKIGCNENRLAIETHTLVCQNNERLISNDKKSEMSREISEIGTGHRNTNSELEKDPCNRHKIERLHCNVDVSEMSRKDYASDTQVSIPSSHKVSDPDRNTRNLYETDRLKRNDGRSLVNDDRENMSELERDTFDRHEADQLKDRFRHDSEVDGQALDLRKDGKSKRKDESLKEGIDEFKEEMVECDVTIKQENEEMEDSEEMHREYVTFTNYGGGERRELVWQNVFAVRPSNFFRQDDVTGPNDLSLRSIDITNSSSNFSLMPNNFTVRPNDLSIRPNSDLTVNQYTASSVLGRETSHSNIQSEGPAKQKYISVRQSEFLMGPSRDSKKKGSFKHKKDATRQKDLKKTPNNSNIHNSDSDTQNCGLTKPNVYVLSTQDDVINLDNLTRFRGKRPRSPEPKIPSKCHLCGKVLSCRKSLGRHLVLHTKAKTLKCNFCDKMFHTKQEVQSHEVIHSGKKEFECKVCNKKFGRKGGLIQHSNIHKPEKKYTCMICQRGFNQYGSLKTHELEHTGQKNFLCDFCGKQFKVKAQLNAHVVKHIGGPTYECTICHKQFNYKGTLTKHIRVHTGERRYKCDSCNGTFRTRSDMVKHSIIHTGRKDHECLVCGKRFSRKENLNQHLTIHTGENKHQCQYCRKFYAQKSSLTRHITTIHKNDNSDDDDDDSDNDDSDNDDSDNDK